MSAIEVRVTRSLERVRAKLLEPAQWEAATDDGAPDRETWGPATDPRVVYLEALDRGQSIGFFCLYPRGVAMYEIHAAIDLSRVKTSTAAARAAIAWVWRNTSATRIVAEIPATNRLAVRVGKLAGLRHYGRNPGAFLKGGQLRDLILLGIDRAPGK